MPIIVTHALGQRRVPVVEVSFGEEMQPDERNVKGEEPHQKHTQPPAGQA
jgi:hypothetical protein